MIRVLRPELLDTLPADNPAAKRSRADLRRVNGWMGHRRIFLRALKAGGPTELNSIVELGAVDGTLALAIAPRLHRQWSQVELTLLDRQPVIAESTRNHFQRIGWTARVVESDVFDWFASGQPPVDVIMTNLFLHHFEASELRRLFQAIAAHCRYFIALEPGRNQVARLGAGCLGLIGCNHVTRHDARVSVQAGFCGRELTALWPISTQWRVLERRDGLFSHLFVAQRISE